MIAAAAAARSPLLYEVDTVSTTDSDPGDGLLKLNNGTQSAATEIYVDNQNVDAVDLSTYFGSLPQSAFVLLSQIDDASVWRLFKVTAVASATGYYRLTVTNQAGAGSFADEAVVALTFDCSAPSGAGSGDVVGPEGSTDSAIALFDSTTGKLLKDSAVTISTDGTLSADSDSNVATEKAVKAYVDANAGASDATDVAYAPTTAADWDGGTDPGDAQEAFDQLAERVKDLEADATGGGFGYQWVPAGAITPSATGGCQSLTTIASAANQPDIQTLNFDGTTQEYGQFAIAPPAGWSGGTVTFAPVWSHPSTTTNFGVVWDLQAVAVSNDDTILANFGTAQTSTDTGGTTDDLYIGPTSAAITIAGTPADGDMVFFRIGRVTGDGSDTMAVDARLHGVRVFFA